MRIPSITYHQGRNNYSDKDGRHYGIAIHNTSNTASDTNEANYADHRTDGTSSHFYVDRDSVTQSLDTDAKAGHAGSANGNENAIAFELTGTNDKSRDWWLANIAWGQLGYVIAYILHNDPDFAGFQVRRASVSEMQSNPKVRAFYGHDDMRRAWGGTTHTDPGPNFPWDRLFDAVNTALGGAPATPTNTSSGGDDDVIKFVQLAGDGSVWMTDTFRYRLVYLSEFDVLRKIHGWVDGQGRPRDPEQWGEELRPTLGVRVDVPAVTVDVPALAALLAGELDVDQAAVVAALESPAGQAALVRADNTAEDS